MSAARTTTRHRGPWLDWKPQKTTQVLLDQVQMVLDEYREHLPLTARQVFYRLVGAHGYEKTEAGYTRLLNALGNARRKGTIAFDSIRDVGVTHSGAGGFDGKAQFHQYIARQAHQYWRNRQEGQASRVEVWCEAAGMVPQLRKASVDYGVPVYSSSGFDSLTAKHDAAKRAARVGSLVVLHIGDHDPSGVHLFTAAAEDVQAWAEHFGGSVRFVRVAVTPLQIERYGLATSPAKRTDNRSFDGETCQAEALDPATLAQIVTIAIEEQLDLDVYRRILELEETEKAELVAESEARYRTTDDDEYRISSDERELAPEPDAVEPTAESEPEVDPPDRLQLIIRRFTLAGDLARLDKQLRDQIEGDDQ